MIPLISRALLCLSLTIILAVSIENIILGFASKNKKSALNNISGASMMMITDISLAVWALFGAIYVGLSYHYTRFNPFWTAANLVTVLLMTAFFTSYLKFDPFDWPIWGPFATVLGIISRAGLEAVYNSADRELANNLWNNLWGSNNISAASGYERNSSSGGPGSHPLVTIQRRHTAE